MEKEFKNLIKTRFPYLCNTRLLLAVSGGVDSMVLACLCAHAHLDFSIAHCNFMLRGEESDGDESFVRNFAEQLEVPFFTQAFQTEKYASEKGISTQMAARDLRYEWFEELRKTNRHEYILTAHHANDNLETFLINLIRGTGPEGLSGISEKNHKVIRPLLSFSRKEIEAYAAENKLEWREDSSNASDKYMRNKIRHQLVPVMMELNPQLLQSFAKTQDHLRENMDLVEDYISLLYPKLVQKDLYGYQIDLDFLKKIPSKNQILYQLLKSFRFTEWDDVYNLVDAQSGKMVFSPTHRLIRDRETLLLTERRVKTGRKHYVFEENEKFLMIPGGILRVKPVSEIGETAANKIYVAREKLNFPLVIRRWKKGDYFHPFGMKGKKKLKDYFRDEKFSIPEKEDTWILCSGEEIVWIVNHRADDRFKVEPETREILQVSFG
ncbi:tRNA lysidine(34) synthetase TilS [Christiangramia flava]|uniref:tRNA(Ile)-lysidine synthase n=1 Tax=Christiangramia flava JLT2011 TaxID=1229726 RepID=A0A1L7I018_9FLAO|nr:tRNA lysidine(34) synthetase TilS [Christiangramia flava]APU66938.1 tRNA(Ile)-lysidine synthetase [Christiangramia flava JLT2011]OSS38037.1 tRNA(Ile)-lysidine synthetase [Christiangramia flava JLT2011]